MARTVCIVKGDDASPEVVVPVAHILGEMDVNIEFLWPVTGDEALVKFGEIFPSSSKEAIDKSDCALVGSTRSVVGVHGYVRWGKECYANLRPTKYFEGFGSPLKNPDGIDFVIARENLEGLYPGWEGDIDELAPLNLINEKIGLKLDTGAKGKFAIKITSEKNNEKSGDEDLINGEDIVNKLDSIFGKEK